MLSEIFTGSAAALRYSSYALASCAALALVACAPTDGNAPQGQAKGASAAVGVAAGASGAKATGATPGSSLAAAPLVSAGSANDPARCGHGMRLAKCIGAPLKLQMGDPSLLQKEGKQ
ncbi:hypothetical protein G3O06_23665 [Burkholderia sp. Ac-20345]|uniref:hypothetical protein n=1 Tax=Burkholderia sp. Ac-20345 TaxID=2703891 RepID=UPI00197B7582|nr:hypothetical protein [Burkholderia sp. Ac-20345]MBN3780516.1 hypothetical protein [Burkholderia sp. Ac-20345]